jgi:hypothetical protein
MNWYYETLPPQTKKALDLLSAEVWLEESNWYLAGGTALALQAGTRKSYDLDFFTTESEFNGNLLLANFLRTTDWKPNRWRGIRSMKNYLARRSVSLPIHYSYLGGN